MISAIDWVYMRRSLLVFFVCLLVGGGLVGSAWVYSDAQKKVYDEEKNRLNRIFANYKTLLKDISLIEQYIRQFDDLQEIGLVGEERRLSWVEALQESNQSLKLPILAYTLTPRLQMDRPLLKSNKKIVPYSSGMTLDMGLLHEADLLKLLALLDQAEVGKFYVNNCLLQRITRTDQSLQTQKPNLNARCQINWVSIEVDAK